MMDHSRFKYGFVFSVGDIQGETIEWEKLLAVACTALEKVSTVNTCMPHYLIIPPPHHDVTSVCT